MKEINEACKKKGAKFLIVNRKYYDLLLKAIAKDQGFSQDEYFLAEAETYKKLIVAVTDKKEFTFEVI